MSKETYIGVAGVARKVKKAYIGVDGVARKVKKAYIGDAEGKARLVFTDAATITINLGSNVGDVTYTITEPDGTISTNKQTIYSTTTLYDVTIGATITFNEVYVPRNTKHYDETTDLYYTASDGNPRTDYPYIIEGDKNYNFRAIQVQGTRYYKVTINKGTSVESYTVEITSGKGEKNGTHTWNVTYDSSIKISAKAVTPNSTHKYRDTVVEVNNITTNRDIDLNCVRQYTLEVTTGTGIEKFKLYTSSLSTPIYTGTHYIDDLDSGTSYRINATPEPGYSYMSNNNGPLTQDTKIVLKGIYAPS
jgi:hypothetical protein